MEILLQIFFYVTVILVTSSFGRPVWFLVQGIQLIGLALLYLDSPSFCFDTVLHMMIGEYDHINNFVIRSMAIWYISQAFILLYYRNSTDHRFVFALLQSQIVAYLLETLAHVPFFGKGNLSPTILHYPDKGSVFPAYVCLGNLVQLLMMNKPQTSPCHINNINDRIDGIAMLVLGTSVLAFPKEIMLFTTTRTELYCDSLVPAAAVGSYIMYCGLLSLQSDTFEKTECKKVVHLTRIVECFSTLVLVFLYWTFSDLFTSNVIWVFLVLALLLCNSFLALRNSNTSDKVKM